MSPVDHPHRPGTERRASGPGGFSAPQQGWSVGSVWNLRTQVLKQCGQAPFPQDAHKTKPCTPAAGQPVCPCAHSPVLPGTQAPERHLRPPPPTGPDVPPLVSSCCLSSLSPAPHFPQMPEAMHWGFRSACPRPSQRLLPSLGHIAFMGRGVEWDPQGAQRVCSCPGHLQMVALGLHGPAWQTS